MTQKEIQLIKSSWQMFRSINPVLVGDVFYTKLFYNYPQLKNLFNITKEEQSKKLIDMLNVIVGRIDKPEALSEEINALSLRHVGYGVKPQQYKAVGIALLWTLQQGLGSDWTEEVAAAWEACFTTLADAMIKAAYSD